MKANGGLACRGPVEEPLIEVCACMTVGIDSYSDRSLKLPRLSRNL